MFPPVKVRTYFSPVIQWQVSWCTWFIDFNLHSQVAYQAADGEREMKTPHISSTDCASHFVTCLTFKQVCHELHRIRLFCRDISETRRLWGVYLVSPVQPLLPLLSQPGACTAFPACTGWFQSLRRQEDFSSYVFRMQSKSWGDVFLSARHNKRLLSSLLLHELTFRRLCRIRWPHVFSLPLSHALQSRSFGLNVNEQLIHKC